MIDPATIAGLHFSTTLMWWDMPGHPLACTMCGKPQVWWLPVDRFRRIRHDDYTQPPPGWGYCVCGYCGGLLALVLRPFPAQPKSPPYLMELNPKMLRHAAVQFRLADDTNTREPRWRSATVTRQRDGGALDLVVTLSPLDPEYRQQLATCAQVVRYRRPDVDGAPQWRTAIVADSHADGTLDLTVHMTPADQEREGKAFQRVAGVTYGDAVGQYKESAITYPICLPVEAAARGSDPGQWLPVG